MTRRIGSAKPFPVEEEQGHLCEVAFAAGNFITIRANTSEHGTTATARVLSFPSNVTAKTQTN